MEYQQTICLNAYSGHNVAQATSSCSVCGALSTTVARYCGGCAAERRVCCVCGKTNTWTQEDEPARMAGLLLDILEQSDHLEARQVAIHGLSQIQYPGTLERMMAFASEPSLCGQLAEAIGAFADERYITFLAQVLAAVDDREKLSKERSTEIWREHCAVRFGCSRQEPDKLEALFDDGESELWRYLEYLEWASGVAAKSLALMGTKEPAKKALLAAARQGHCLIHNPLSGTQGIVRGARILSADPEDLQGVFQGHIHVDCR